MENCIAIEQDLQRIADILLLNGRLTDCSGLIHGKMGIAVFFFHYAHYTDETLFAGYAIDLIEEIQSQLHANSRSDYEKGIAGIGTGIDYLLQNDFLGADGDILDDFDERMYRAVMYDPWQNFSLYDGLTGYGRYWISRLRQQSSFVQAEECLMRITERIEVELTNIPIEEQTDVYCFLSDLYEISGLDISIELMEQCRKQSADISPIFTSLVDSVICHVIRVYKRSRYFSDISQREIDIALKQIPDLDMEKSSISMGLLSGYAGEGLLRLTALNSTDISWLQLL